jgi:hypothetical protein
MVLAVFVDGLGLAPDEPARNPTRRYPALGELLRLAAPLDACLGMPGLPQSATGQVSLFCGLNAAAAAGGHQPGFPGRALRALLAADTFYHRVIAAGGRATFLNAFGTGYLKRMAGAEARASASTLAAVAAGLPLRTASSLARGQAVYQDLTGEGLANHGEVVPRMTPEAAAEVALGVAAEHDLTLFEFFQTDVAGHRRDGAYTELVLARLDAFLGALAANLPASAPSCHYLALFSDHGNVEDGSMPSHTTNPVPLAIWPPVPKEQLQVGSGGAPASIADVYDVLIRLALDKPAAGEERSAPGA